MQCYNFSIKNTFLEIESSSEICAARRKTAPAQLWPLTPQLERSSFTLCTASLEHALKGCKSDLSLSTSTAASESDVPVKQTKLDRFVSTHETTSEKTTVMIRNIPNRYSLEWLLEEVQETGLECNLVHLPLIKRSNANVGYAFVNFVSAEQAEKFKEAFEEHRFIRQPGSKKRANVIFAKLQGYDENVEFFSKRRGNAPWIREQC